MQEPLKTTAVKSLSKLKFSIEKLQNLVQNFNFFLDRSINYTRDTIIKPGEFRFLFELH